MTVVITAVARDLLTDKGGLFKRLVLRRQLYLGNGQPRVVACKLVNLEGVASRLDQPARLVDDAWVAECQQLAGIVQRNLLFKLIARKTAIETGAFNSNVRAFISYTYTNSTSALATNVALLDVTL